MSNIKHFYEIITESDWKDENNVQIVYSREEAETIVLASITKILLKDFFSPRKYDYYDCTEDPKDGRYYLEFDEDKKDEAVSIYLTSFQLDKDKDGNIGFFRYCDNDGHITISIKEREIDVDRIS